MISKIADVKKYQETWSRHQRFQYRRIEEMLKYLLGIAEYDCSRDDQRRQQFMKRILEIEHENIEKFADNLDNKEVSLREGLDAVKPGAGKEE